VHNREKIKISGGKERLEEKVCWNPKEGLVGENLRQMEFLSRKGRLGTGNGEKKTERHAQVRERNLPGKGSLMRGPIKREEFTRIVGKTRKVRKKEAGKKGVDSEIL